MTVEYYGRGLRFPVQLGLAGLGQSAGVAKVEESIRVLLGTQYGERVMRPRFGSNLGTLAFAPNNTSTANLARYYVANGDAVMRQMIEDQIEAESLAMFLSGRMLDDGIIDPRDTRTVLGMSLSAVHSQRVEGRRGFGVFRM